MPVSDVQAAVTPSRLLIRVAPDPTHLLRARERLRDYLYQYCCDDEAVEQVVLAVDEACTNALRHSGSEAELEIGLGFEADDLVVQVRDHGRGFDTTRYDPEKAPDPLANDGRGLYLIGRLMDRLELRSDDGLMVRMHKSLARRPDVRDIVGVDPQGDVTDGSAGRQSRRRAVTEEMGEAFAALDWEYRFVRGNQAALDLYGLDPENALGRTVWEVFPPAEDLPVGLGIRRAMQLGISAIEEFVSPSLGRWLECRVYPTTSGVNVFVRDIHERKSRELAHQEERKRAELLASTTARLLSAEEPQHVVDDLCHDVMTHLGCHVFFNYLVDPDAGCLALNAYAGIPADEAARIGVLGFGVAVCGCAASQAERVMSEDVQHNHDPRAELVRSYGVQAYAAHPLMVRGEVLGTLSFGARDRPRFTEAELTLMKTVADQVAIAIDRDRAERELRRREVEAAAQDERGRLARDLHDSVTQALFAASLKAEALTLTDEQIPPAAAETMDQVRRLSRGALAQMRTMLLELRGERFEDVPLRQLLQNLVETAESRARVDVGLRITGEPLIPRSLHVTLYRVAQEALNNVVRHSQATRATVELQAEERHISLLIHDDGRGFEPGEFGAVHLGLRSMRERAEEVGAVLHVVSAPGEGTLINLDWTEPAAV
jgi:PAS domain S-box-containing protein